MAFFWRTPGVVDFFLVARTGHAARARRLQMRGPFGLPCGVRSPGAREANSALRASNMPRSSAPSALRSSAPHRRRQTHAAYPVLTSGERLPGCLIGALAGSLRGKRCWRHIVRVGEASGARCGCSGAYAGPSSAALGGKRAGACLSPEGASLPRLPPGASSAGESRSDPRIEADVPAPRARRAAGQEARKQAYPTHRANQAPQANEPAYCSGPFIPLGTGSGSTPMPSSSSSRVCSAEAWPRMPRSSDSP